MTNLTRHRDLFRSRPHKSAKLKAWFHSTRASAKAAVLRLTLPKSRPSKPCLVPDASAVSTLAVSPRPTPNTPLIPSKSTSTVTVTPSSITDATTIRPVSTTSNSKNPPMRDSGVVLPPEDYPISVTSEGEGRKSTSRPNEGTPAPEPKSLSVKAAPFGPSPAGPSPADPPSRADTKAAFAAAIRRLGRCQPQSRPRLHLFTIVLQLMLDKALTPAGTTALGPYARDSKSPWGANSPLHCFDTPTLMRMLSPLLEQKKVLSTAYDKSFDICRSLARVPSLSYTVFTVSLDPALFLPDEEYGYPPLPPYSEATCPVNAAPKPERAPNGGKRPAPTGQKRPQPSPDPQGEDRKRRRPDNGAKKKRVRVNDEDEDDDGDERRTNQPHTIPSLQGEDGRDFACPFYKHDPLTHRICLFRQTLTGTNYVKQHLRRYHLPPMHCPSCGRVFGLQSDLDGHIRERTCEQREFTHPGLTQTQQEALKRVPREGSPKERWYKMWDIIFPNAPRPASPYVSDPWIEVIENSFALWEEQGGVERLRGNDGTNLSAFGQGAQEPAEMWQAIRADMVAAAERLIHPQTDLDGQTAGQLLENQSGPGSFSSYGMVSRHNNPSSTQGQAGTGTIPTPARDGRDPPVFLAPTSVPADPGMYGPAVTSSATGYGMGYGSGVGSRVAQAGYAPRSFQYNPYWPGGFQGGMTGDLSFATDLQPFGSGYDASVIDPFPTLPGRQAPGMLRSASTRSAAEGAGMRTMRGGGVRNLPGARGLPGAGLMTPGQGQGRAQGQGGVQGGQTQVGGDEDFEAFGDFVYDAQLE
ncbi:uncharacterized protein DNG_10301 [Cephalotrichum gorgonifer]|uniref:C2H2-type domain-containing protein n=1 Tax=Cephalotrichum gorgonifer TaxID=2041049 RepID=A0AAE8T074_9PEZI|nr:uncharacterized protein DNG_10301 [Cephalotrichum gorgonifer]